MTIYFITGNEKKFKEAKKLVDDLEQLSVDLPEIQHMDAHEVLKAKLQEAFKYHEGEFIVEDTSLYMSCLNGLPGPLNKWFFESLGNDGVYEVANKLGNLEVEAKTVVGYARSPTDIHFFEGVLPGRLVEPREGRMFGWDPIFQPKGYEKVFGEFTTEEKNKISMRGKAFKKFAEFLESGE